ncbi:unnamed protein product, partial [Polarella glacialis]
MTADDVKSDVELQDFCVAMMFAGHDTTLSTMQSVLYWLSKQPVVLAELRQEVLAVWDGSSQLTRETLGKVPKVRAFLQEAWRLTPPVTIINRNLDEEAVIDGYLVPKGWMVSFAAPLVGQKVEQPSEFRMGRYLDPSGHFVDQTFESWNYGVFGGGPRMCMGYKFARDEMLVFMIQLLRHFSFTIASAEAERAGHLQKVIINFNLKAIENVKLGAIALRLRAISRIMTNVDKDSDAMISPQEFYQLLSQKFEKGDPKSEIQDVFNRMDKNHDGQLDIDEMHEVSTILGENIPKSEIKDMIKMFNRKYQEDLKKYNMDKKKPNSGAK